MALLWTCIVAACIVMSTLVEIAQSLPRYKNTNVLAKLNIMAMVFNAIFTVELFLRAVSYPSYRTCWTDVHNWIDVAALVPVFIEWVRATSTRQYRQMCMMIDGYSGST
jgi:hypothetical protein